MIPASVSLGVSLGVILGVSLGGTGDSSTTFSGF